MSEEEAPATAIVAELRRELTAARAEREALADELKHRIRNMLAVIRSVFRRTVEAGAPAEQVIEHFEGRMDAIARYQLAAAGHGVAIVELEDVIRDELLGTMCLDGPGCTIEGPPVLLDAETVVPMTLAVHELSTNAIKFGALSRDGAALDVRWTLAPGATGALLTFDWTETGIAVVRNADDLRGFGRQFVEDALPYQIGATSSFDFAPGKLHVRIAVPLRQAGAPGADHPSEESDQWKPS